ncbi:hypothetical protein [Staphylococcus warneri]|uniref:hypothetical protein n=1 Tax=Staphylococcus warneri TaxID=1292 RepID=UPI001FB42B44|nr:hypothetical protein [Staphylococcus warneri]MCJ1786335.1 hypothetical protein [Staphylococcus warneri]MCJ1788731.1 hypothetical protein [Staphylococcus warneri]MCJ1791159.1 hypothetical protein [Staphylococcus warneri]MCJ1793618.1 hypothetical protein [Staphylococcus warneri]MCJ1796166.1 hypothetical protein [Staphylococcus warneri]
MNWISLIALCVSILSFVLTAYKYWIDFKENKLKIGIDLIKYYGASDRHVYEINFVNETKNPVSVNKVVLCHIPTSTKIESHQNKVLLTKSKNIRNESSVLPINLSAYASEKAFLVFDTNEILRTYYFEIYTSKGLTTFKPEKIKLKPKPLSNLGGVSINK